MGVWGGWGGSASSRKCGGGGQRGGLRFSLELPLTGADGDLRREGLHRNRGPRISLQEAEREKPPQDLVGVVLFGDGVLRGIAFFPGWNPPCLSSLSPSPVSLLPLQVPLERHDGGIRLGDNQVGSVWSERRGQPLRAGRWRRRQRRRRRGRDCGPRRRQRRQGYGRGRRQQRRDEPCGAAPLPAATGRSWRLSPATRGRGEGRQASSHYTLATWGPLLSATQPHFNILEKVQPAGTPSVRSRSSGH